MRIALTRMEVGDVPTMIGVTVSGTHDIGK